MLEQLDTDDWREAFGFAGEGYHRLRHEGGGTWAQIDGADSGRSPPAPTAAVPGSSVSVERFARKDVAHVEALSEGENDGDPWLCLGELTDGRWFYLEAWCDYTGWD